MIRTRIALQILLISVVTCGALAQESRSQGAATPSAPAKKASSRGDRVILKVGDVQITQSEFESRIGDIEPEGDPDKGGDIDKDRRKLGDDYASVLMLSKQAVANHLDTTPEVSRQLEVDRLQILSDAQFAELMRQATPSLEEIHRYYSSHPAEFERVKIRRLFIWKLGAGSKNTHGLAPEVARDRADAILHAPTPEATKLVSAFADSDEGQLDAAASPFVRGALPPKLEKVAFSMKEGEWTQGDDSADAITLLYLFKRERRSLEEVASLVKQKLQGEKMLVKMNDLKKQAGIWMDEEYFGPALATSPSNELPTKLGKSTGKQENIDEDARRK